MMLGVVYFTLLVILVHITCDGYTFDSISVNSHVVHACTRATMQLI